MLDIDLKEPEIEPSASETATDPPPITTSFVARPSALASSALGDRAKWYNNGLWPFRRISFECPGCSRWLSIKSVHAGRVGLCPSCDLTISAPEPKEELPPALVSRSKTSHSETGAGLNGLTPDNDRKLPVVGDEDSWGLSEDTSLVPFHVVTRYQTVLPWIGLAVVVGLAVGVGFWIMSANQHEPRNLAMENEAAKAAVRSNAKPAAKMSSQLWVVLDSLATAENADEMSALVRNPEQMLPKMRSYYAEGHSKLPHRFERARPGLKIFDIDGTSFARFEGRCDGRPVKFAFEWTEYGWRLDWESLVGYSDTNWANYLETRPEEQREFRLLTKVSRGEGLEFDRDRFRCLVLEDHLGTRRAHALVERTGVVESQMQKFFQLHIEGGEPRTWITPVVKPVEGSDQLLEIVDLKSGSWLIP